MVFCVGELADQGAGHPDFGLYTAKQVQRGRPREGQTPERGVVEVKSPHEDLRAPAVREQVTRYWGHYRLVLVTNLYECGTGAYLAEVLRRIAANLGGHGLGALTGARVRQAATERVFGFELMPAPFVVAHLQVGLTMQDLDAPLADDGAERAGIFLTNALTGWEPRTTKPLPDLFPASFPGVKTDRDAFLVDVDLDRLRARVADYFNPALSHEDIARHHPRRDEKHDLGLARSPVRCAMRGSCTVGRTKPGSSVAPIGLSTTDGSTGRRTPACWPARAPTTTHMYSRETSGSPPPSIYGREPHPRPAASGRRRSSTSPTPPGGSRRY